MIEKIRDVKRILFGEFGYEFTSHPKTIAPVLLSVRGIIQNEKGEYLVVKRSRSDKRDGSKWEFPGGKVERGEFDPIQTLIHEIHEETNLEIEISKASPYCIIREAIEQKSSPYTHFALVTLYYKCKPTTNDLKISFEHEEYAWKKLNEINGALEISKFTEEIMKSGFLDTF